jgi:hypothetical protein
MSKMPLSELKALLESERNDALAATRASKFSVERADAPAGAAVPDRDSLQADDCGPTYTYDSNTRLKLEAKDHMRARGVKSPDEWDAVALTFAEPVAPNAGFSRRLEYPRSGIA